MKKLLRKSTPMSMTLDDWGDYTVSLLKTHLPSSYKDWEVEFFSSETIAGLCYPHRRIIQISMYVIKRLTNSQIQGVIKHEVAHAIAFTVDGSIAHNELWRAICRYIECSDDLSITYNLNFYPSDLEQYKRDLKTILDSKKNEYVEEVDLSLLPW
jgi:hypothetical protein